MSKQATPPPPGDKPTPQKPPPPPPRWRHWLLPVGIIVALFLWIYLPAVHQAGQTTLTYSQFLSDVHGSKVKSITIPQSGGSSTGTLKDGTNYTVVIPPQAGASLLTQLESAGVQTSSTAPSPGFGSELLSWLLILAPFLLFGWFWMRLSRGASGQLQGVLGAGLLPRQGVRRGAPVHHVRRRGRL